MHEVHPNLWIGDQRDYEYGVSAEPGWRVVHACKHPYHRDALGYVGNGAPKLDPEYLVARRGDRLILNLIDTDAPGLVPVELMDAAVTFVGESLGLGLRVLVHCNQGRSRAPTVGLLALVVHSERLPLDSAEEALDAFAAIYEPYRPAGGMRGFVRGKWDHYVGMRAASR